MKDNVIFYSKEDVGIAEWLLNTQNRLNHGLVPLLWALKVMTWYAQFYQHVMLLKKKLYSVPLKECLCRVVSSIKDGKLCIRDTPYYHPQLAN